MAGDQAGAEPRLDQTVYRWSWGHLLDRKGMGPVATSLGVMSELRGWDGELDHHVSMDRSHPECPEWSMVRVRFKDRYALLLREAAIHGTNRPGTDTHVLLDPHQSVEPHVMLATAWLHAEDRRGLTGTREALAEVPERIRLPPVAIRPDARDPEVWARIRQHARRRHDLVEVVLAAVLREPHRTFTLRVGDVGDDFVPVLWGVFELGMTVAALGLRTFSTFETNDGPVKPRFVLVPEWPVTQPPQERLRIAPELEPHPEEDEFAAAAAMLVDLYRRRSEWPEWQRNLGKVRRAPPELAARERANLVLELTSGFTRPVPVVSLPPMVDQPGQSGQQGQAGDGSGDRAGDERQGPRVAPQRPTLSVGTPEDDRSAGDHHRGDPFLPMRPAAPPAELRPDRALDPRLRPGAARPRVVLPGWPEWNDRGATPVGFDAMYRAAGALQRAGGRESDEPRDALERADLVSLVVALRLVDHPPLLRHVVQCLEVALVRDRDERRTPNRHVRPILTREVIRLHENIDAIHGCGAPPETAHHVVYLLARLVVGLGKEDDRELGEALAGTVWTLDRLGWDTTAYQQMLIDALWFSPCCKYFLQKYGLLTVEGRKMVPRRADPRR